MTVTDPMTDERCERLCIGEERATDADIAQLVSYLRRRTDTRPRQELLHRLLDSTLALTSVQLTLLTRGLFDYSYPLDGIRKLLGHPRSDVNTVCALGDEVLNSWGGPRFGSSSYRDSYARDSYDRCERIITYLCDDPHPVVATIARLRRKGADHFHPLGRQGLAKLDSLAEANVASAKFTAGMRELAALGPRGFSTAQLLHEQSGIAGPGLVETVKALHPSLAHPSLLLADLTDTSTR